MALTGPTAKIGSSSATSYGSGAYTTASFTPSNSSLLVVAVSLGFDDAGPDTYDFNPTISDSAGLTWTQRVSIASETGGWDRGTRVWTAPVTTGASMTVSIDHGSVSVYAYAVSVVEFTGHDTTTPTGATASDAALATNGADSITLSGSPASDSVVMAYLHQEMNSGAGGAQEGTDFTELQDFGTSGGIYLETQYRTGSTSPTVGWQDTMTGAGSIFSIDAVALEIKAAAGGGGTTTRRYSLSLTGVG